MTLLTWSHHCSVGVKAMDDQHGILMDTMNELYLELVRGCDRKQLDAQMERLIEFSRMHFESEERLLEQHGFPGFAEHREAHRQLLRQIRETVDRMERTEGEALRSFLDFLRAWYSEHIEGLDQQYGAWLNEKGVY